MAAPYFKRATGARFLAGRCGGQVVVFNTEKELRNIHSGARAAKGASATADEAFDSRLLAANFLARGIIDAIMIWWLS
jgi:hypothetical protein